jgi:hypothetical protein
MRTCPTCGASVADDLEWCNQCYSALPAVPAPAEAVSASAAGSERPLWTRAHVGNPPVKIEPEFSRWRGGATSFGPIRAGAPDARRDRDADRRLPDPARADLHGHRDGHPGVRIDPLVRGRRHPGRRLPAEPRLETRTVN